MMSRICKVIFKEVRSDGSAPWHVYNTCLSYNAVLRIWHWSEITRPYVFCKIDMQSIKMNWLPLLQINSSLKPLLKFKSIVFSTVSMIDTRDYRMVKVRFFYYFISFYFFCFQHSSSTSCHLATYDHSHFCNECATNFLLPEFWVMLSCSTKWWKS